MVTYVAPPGWPPQVLPPDAPGWERTAVNWLFDLCPPEYRSYPAVRRHVVVLARFAVLHIEANQLACRRGLSEARRQRWRPGMPSPRGCSAFGVRSGWSRRPCVGAGSSLACDQ